jgi:hypothetical protein
VNTPASSLTEVRRLARLLEAAHPPLSRGLTARRSSELISTGSPPLDRLLPQPGWPRGSLVEWLSEEPGSGAATLALVAAREAHADGGAVVVIDRAGTFYPPAAAAWRLDLASTIIVHPTSEKDEHWALDQSLRCEHVAAVLAWPRRLDDRTFRRLQLAAESTGALGLFIRSATAQREPSWAAFRLLITSIPPPKKSAAPQSEPGRPRPRRSALNLPAPPRASAPRASPEVWQLAVRLLHCRGHFGKKEGQVLLEIDEQTGDIHEAHSRPLAPQLAHPTPASL